jgi:hypothetical protein
VCIRLDIASALCPELSYYWSEKNRFLNHSIAQFLIPCMPLVCSVLLTSETTVISSLFF